VLRNPELANDTRFTGNAVRVENRPAFAEEINDALSSLAAEEVLARLDAADIANALQRDMHELASHPQLYPAATDCATSTRPSDRCAPSFRP
jgi:itaconate CoA-transferase